MKALTSNLTTHCVGRYLIDIPAGATVSDMLTVQGVSIDAKAMSLDDHRKAITARSDKLAGIKSLLGHRFLYTDAAIEEIPESRHFLSLGSQGTTADTRLLIEAYRWDNGYQIRMKIKADDEKHFKNDSNARNATDIDDAPAKVKRMASLLSRARGRADDQIPTEPGACFQGGFLAGPQWDSEDVTTSFILPNHNDVSVDMETNTNVHDISTLLQRSAEINAFMSHTKDGKTLRKGTVRLDGITAEEWIIKGTTGFNIPGFLFFMEANSLPNKYQKPVVMLYLQVGAPTAATGDAATIERASLTEDQSIEVWDTFSRTLRPRPNAF